MPEANRSSEQPAHSRIFREHRGLLFGIAYRMLGSVQDAEDILQDAYLNWSQADLARIESPVAFLRTIVSRRCLDQLKSARTRRESYVGPWLPEPYALSGGAAADGHADWIANIADDRPDAAAEYERGEILRESLSIAFLILLESLGPVERAVYLLREVFAVDFAEIAGVVQKSADNCRQILHRARAAVERRRPGAAPDPAQAQQLLEQFLSAVRSGDLPAFTALLADDVRYHSDGGGVVQAALNIIQGADNVARFQLGVLKFLPADVQLEPRVLNGAPGLVIYAADGQVYATLAADFSPDGRVQNIYSVRNPEKLRHLARPAS